MAKQLFVRVKDNARVWQGSVPKGTQGAKKLDKDQQKALTGAILALDGQSAHQRKVNAFKNGGTVKSTANSVLAGIINSVLAGETPQVETTPEPATVAGKVITKSNLRFWDAEKINAFFEDGGRVLVRS